MVAREADVSERHLAQLELGDGNISIVLLRRIATALNASLADLFSPKVHVPDDEKRMIGELLERLPSNRLQETLRRLTRELANEEKSRRSRIALIGLRGAGKSTLGDKLSREMNDSVHRIGSRNRERCRNRLSGDFFALRTGRLPPD